MNRIVWCTPGRIDEADLISAVTAAGGTIARRCVDAADLLAAATIESEALVVIDEHVPRLGSDVVASIQMQRPGRIVGLVDNSSGRSLLESSGVTRFVDACGTHVIDEILAACSTPAVGAADVGSVQVGAQPGAIVDGRVIAVTGPPGSPGRSAIALGLAEAYAQAGDRVCVVDADTFGPSLSTVVGMTEDVSGLLVAARYADQGALDARSLGASCRRLRDGLWIMTGIGAPDRWTAVRAAALDRVWAACSTHFDRVVIDAGVLVDSGVVDDPLHAGLRERDAATRSALRAGDKTLIVCEPTALSVLRLIQVLPAITELADERSCHVVVNRVGRRDRHAVRRVTEALTEAGQHLPIHGIVDDEHVRSGNARGALLSEVPRAKRIKRDLRDVARALAA